MVLRARQDGAASAGRALPPTVQAVVAARLDSLRHRLRDLARRASVFIFSFDQEELATVSDAEPEDLQGLEEAEILVRRRAAGRHAGGSATRRSGRSRTRACPSASGGACTRRSRRR